MFLLRQSSLTDFAAVDKARSFLKADIAGELRDQFMALYIDGQNSSAYSPDAASAGRRALKNVALGYLGAIEGDVECLSLIVNQYENADNMTDRMAALSLLSDIEGHEREEALENFENQYSSDSLVMDKWFSVQATSNVKGALESVKSLLKHDAFSYKNPNKVRALIGAFSGANPARFHADDGEGYKFLADSIIHLNGINPQVASRILAPLGSWRRMDANHQRMMKAELQRILDTEHLSKDVFEVASKSLA